MSIPEFYYGSDSMSGPFLSASEDPQVESVDEYDQVHTDRRISELRTTANLMSRFWDDAVMHPDYNKRREAFEELELLAIRAEEAINDILGNVALKVDEFNKETGI